ncbi:hypothetical protein IJG78_00510 [Candidatus Saccharibacteria bacterium]|nr:hypothetical protein [Candidatus Saccharibacteria bacterium]
MKKIILYALMMVNLLSGMVIMTPAPVSAASCDGSSMFFGLRPWYYGQTEEINGKCEIKTPKDGDLPKFVWTIVLNILTDISVMIGYIAIVMIAWGGYLYMFSRGLPDRAEKGKKTLISAVIGLLISVLASVIMNTIVSVLTNRS